MREIINEFEALFLAKNELRGVGISDAPQIQDYFKNRQINYTNTFYNEKPILNLITCITSNVD